MVDTMRKAQSTYAALLLLTILAADYVRPAVAFSQGVASLSCALPEATVLRREGNAVLQMWELPAVSMWFGETIPDARGYQAYRSAIRAAGGDSARPVADAPVSKDDAEREIWRNEEHNVALMYSGDGEVRPVRCLDAALFALHDARYSQLTTSTEFIAHVLRRGDRLKVYFSSSDLLVPPKQFYGTAEVAADVSAGWTYWVLLHNHTLQTFSGKPALGVPAPSTSDVQLFRSLADRFGLREVWITNGLYTGVVASENLGRFRARD